MYLTIVLVGFGVTAAITAALWRQARPEQPLVAGIGLGVVCGLVWPLSFWIVVGLWWLGRLSAPAHARRERATQLEQAREYRQFSETEGMLASALYWARQRQDSEEGPRVPARRAAIAAPVVGVCVVGVTGYLVAAAVVARPAPAPPAPAGPMSAASAGEGCGSGVYTGADQRCHVGEQVTVARVVSGDTVVLADGRTVRLLGVDAPATTECAGPAAATFTRTALEGQPVTLVSEPGAERDPDGRSLGYIQYGTSLDLGHQLVRQGWGTVSEGGQANGGYLLALRAEVDRTRQANPHGGTQGGCPSSGPAMTGPLPTRGVAERAYSPEPSQRAVDGHATTGGPVCAVGDRASHNGPCRVGR